MFVVFVVDVCIMYVFLLFVLFVVLLDCDWFVFVYFVMGGDVCDFDMIVCWSVNWWLYNIYGLIECMVFVMMGELCVGDSNWCIGWLIVNVCCYVFVVDGCLVFIGEEGELCIVGVGVGFGYFGWFDLSVECFVVDLYGMLGVMMYWIGDIVSWELDGMLCYVGCCDV